MSTSVSSNELLPGDRVFIGGDALSVAGRVRLVPAQGRPWMRYLLESEHGTTLLLESGEGGWRTLRRFLPTAAPAPEGKELAVQDMRYVLSGVERLTLADAEGAPVDPRPGAGVLLSGRFESGADLILREFPPGEAATQLFYRVKVLSASELRTERDARAERERARIAAARTGAAAAESGEASARTTALVTAGIAVVVAVLLAFSCRSEVESGGAPRGAATRTP